MKLKKRTLKETFLSQKLHPAKPLKTESLAEAHFVISSCRLVSQSSYLSNSKKDCDWLIFGCFTWSENRRFLTPLFLVKNKENLVWEFIKCAGKLDSLSQNKNPLDFAMFCCKAVLCCEAAEDSRCRGKYSTTSFYTTRYALNTDPVTYVFVRMGKEAELLSEVNLIMN